MVNTWIHEHLWKENLNSAGHQFHQYQESIQSNLILSKQKQKQPQNIMLEF